jgi:hypothetical protein
VNCFRHREAVAVGLCKACNKGLCPTCAVDVGQGLACHDTCQEQVRSLNQLVERNIRMSPASEALLGKQPRVYFGTGVFQILAGGAFALLGQGMDGTFRIGIIAVGVLLALSGIWYVAYGLGLRGDAGKPR